MTMLPRVCMRDHIRSALAERIINGVYPPGTRLKELVLAREFNVSQAPVREALRELEVVGLVESQRYRGTRVRGLDHAELLQAYELREVIESAATLRAVPCRVEDLQQLEVEVQGIERCIATRDVTQACMHGMRFHRRLVEMSGNAMYLRAWDGLTWDVRARIAALVVEPDLVRAAADKREVLDALHRGDGVVASALMRGIIQRMMKRIEEAGSARELSAVHEA